MGPAIPASNICTQYVAGWLKAELQGVKLSYLIFKVRTRGVCPPLLNMPLRHVNFSFNGSEYVGNGGDHTKRN